MSAVGRKRKFVEDGVYPRTSPATTHTHSKPPRGDVRGARDGARPDNVRVTGKRGRHDEGEDDRIDDILARSRASRLPAAAAKKAAKAGRKAAPPGAAPAHGDADMTPGYPSGDEGEGEEQEEPVLSPEAAATGFAAAFKRVMTRTVAPDAAPVMAKRHTAAEKLADMEKKELRATTRRRRERVAARTASNVPPSAANLDRERFLRRIGTKGVVALFNAITKHQKALLDAATGDAASTAGSSAASAGAAAGRPGAAGAGHSFLELLKQTSKGVMPSSTAPRASTPAPAPARGASKPAAAAAAAAAAWSVLKDDYMSQHAEEQDDVEEEADGGLPDLLDDSD